MLIGNVFKFLIPFCLVFNKFNCQISDCTLPDDFADSRKNRLLHPCETNRNSFFLIETYENFYCIFYSSFETQIFGEVGVEIKVDGEWEVEETGSDNFYTNKTSISFTVSFSDVILKVSSENDDEMPKIVSVIATTDGNSEEYCSNINCGVKSDAVPVIINGAKVREGSWPWNAAIYYRPAADTIKFRCGSTIINERTVITIATCLVTYNATLQERVALDADKLNIAVGETILFDTSGTRQVLQVDKIKFHDKYKTYSLSDGSYKDDYNVALLILNKNINYSLHVQPICLPYLDEFDFDDKIGKVVGWGFSELGDLKISQHLQDLTVPTYNFLTCMFRAENRSIYNGFSARRNFCAGYKQDRGICTGDSGSGVYIEEETKYYLYGLASFANCECIEQENRCRIFGEGFFVNLVAFMQWILNNMY